ncbi:remodeling and spacing factor 1 [Caerostris extrusa]|uniref:Remodeling and spacing factor 1 n=1 Tax=Caerostris extrusa TaxID=172846 RepID=A0AAV4VU12_CAEEX|nr:remodeling and spacing factor 1 [Caerostris extrusa]
MTGTALDKPGNKECQDSRITPCEVLIKREDLSSQKLTVSPMDIDDTQIEKEDNKEHVPEDKCKGSKIKLYEKWNNEKKQISTCNAKEEIKGNSTVTTIKELVDSKESLPEDLTIKTSESALNKSKTFDISSSKSSNDAPCGDEVPMDLSVSYRSSDIVSKNLATDPTSSNKKRPLTDLDRTSLSYNGGKSSFQGADNCKGMDTKYSNSSEAPRPFKKKKAFIIGIGRYK